MVHRAETDHSALLAWMGIALMCMMMLVVPACSTSTARRRTTASIPVTWTPRPSSTPWSTTTPRPTHTPRPTLVPRPSRTPRPSVTPRPSITPQPSRTPIPTNVPGKPVELSDAMAQRLIEVSIVGKSLEFIDITIKSKVSEPLDVQILAGTIFQPANSATQNMVVRGLRIIYVKPGAEVNRDLAVACANMHKSGPTSSDRFRIKSTQASPDLMKLLSLPAFMKQSFGVQQFAIWTVTDNPTRNEYVWLGTSGAGRGPTDEQIATIKELFSAAGIDTTKYQGLR